MPVQWKYFMIGEEEVYSIKPLISLTHVWAQTLRYTGLEAKKYEQDRRIRIFFINFLDLISPELSQYKQAT